MKAPRDQREGDILSALQLGSTHMIDTQTQPTAHEAGVLIQNGLTAQQVISSWALYRRVRWPDTEYARAGRPNCGFLATKT
jgi:hypothetical protein